MANALGPFGINANAIYPGQTITEATLERYAERAQCADRQVQAHWPRFLNGLARQLNPLHAKLFAVSPVSYYWSTYQSEWATDLVFRDAGASRRLYPRQLYPRLLHHAVTTFGSTDVMRFLGRRLPLSGAVPTRFAGEVVSDLRERAEGIRIKHGVNGELGHAVRPGLHGRGQCAARGGDDHQCGGPARLPAAGR